MAQESDTLSGEVYDLVVEASDASPPRPMLVRTVARSQVFISVCSLDAHTTMSTYNYPREGTVKGSLIGPLAWMPSASWNPDG